MYWVYSLVNSGMKSAMPTSAAPRASRSGNGRRARCDPPCAVTLSIAMVRSDASRCLVPEDAGGPHQQHADDDQVRGNVDQRGADVGAGKMLDHAEQDSADDRAPQRAEPAERHGGESLDKQMR